MFGHVNNRERRSAKRHVLRGYTMLELVAATAIFVTSIGLLAGATTTALSTRVNLSRAATMDSALNRLLNTAASNSWDKLLANTFTPPTPLCETDPVNAGTLSRSCVLINGRSLEVSWAIKPVVSTAGVDGIPQGAADAVVLTASAARADGSIASRSITVNAPNAGYRVATASVNPDAVVRVQLAGSWNTLDSPLLLLAPGADGLYNDTADVLAATNVDAAGGALMRISKTQAEIDALCPALGVALPAKLGCRIALGTGTSRGLTPTHSLDAGSLLGAGGRITLSVGKSTYATARIYRRGVLDVYLQAKNTFSKRQLSNTLSTSPVTALSVSAPEAGSVCLWAKFYDGYASSAQEVPACNYTDRLPVIRDTAQCIASQTVVIASVTSACLLRDPARAVTFETYEPDSVLYAGLTLAIPTDEVISILSDSSAAGCPKITGQRYSTTAGGVSSWVTVSTVGVCSSWTWGRPTSLAVFGGSSSTFPSAAVTISGGGHTAAVATWVGEAGRPAAGLPASWDVVWAKPRDANLCTGMPISCTAPATSPETTGCPTAHCYSLRNAAPYLQFVTPQAGSAQGWPYAVVVAAAASKTFTTNVADPEAETVTLTVQNIPASTHGTLYACNPTCTAAVAGTTITLTSGQSASWRWDALAAGANPGVELKLTDTRGNERFEYLQFPKVAATPVAALALRTVAYQGGTDSNRMFVWDENGNGIGGVTTTWNACTAYSSSATGTTIDGTASSVWAVTGSVVKTTGAITNVATDSVANIGQCSITAAKSGSTYSVVGAFSRTVRAAAGEVTMVLPASTQGSTSVATVTVKDRTASPTGSSLLANWPVAVLAEKTSGGAAQSVWATVPWCITGATGVCTVAFNVGTDTTNSSWVARAKAGSAVTTASSVITRITSRIVGSSTTVRAGSTATMTITTADGAGVALGNMPITIVAPTGTSVSPVAATTNAKGQTTVTITAQSTAVVGKVALAVTSGTVLKSLPFYVEASPQTVTLASTSISLARGAASVTTFAVLVRGGKLASTADAPVPGAKITVTGGDSTLKLSPTVTTDTAGSALITLFAESKGTAGTRTITVKVSGITKTFSVVVT